jgi:predicted nucleic acid-binding protein
MAIYVDTSAAVKLLVREPESAALRRWLSDRERDLVSSDLLRTELMRVALRMGEGMQRAEAILAGIIVLPVTTTTFETAGTLEPASLRSLDALHLAAALDLDDELDAILTYDEGLAAAATANGVDVVAPA